MSEKRLAAAEAWSSLPKKSHPPIHRSRATPEPAQPTSFLLLSLPCAPSCAGWVRRSGTALRAAITKQGHLDELPRPARRGSPDRRLDRQAPPGERDRPAVGERSAPGSPEIAAGS